MQEKLLALVLDCRVPFILAPNPLEIAHYSLHGCFQMHQTDESTYPISPFGVSLLTFIPFQTPFSYLKDLT